jgi:hypothetical protein
LLPAVCSAATGECECTSSSYTLVDYALDDTLHVIVQAIQLCILMELNVLMYLVNNRINDYLFIEYFLIIGIVWFILDLNYTSTSMSRVALINGPGSVPTEIIV